MKEKVRNAQLIKVPCVLVVGDREMSSDTVAIRRCGGSRMDDVPVLQLTGTLLENIAYRA